MEVKEEKGTLPEGLYVLKGRDKGFFQTWKEVVMAYLDYKDLTEVVIQESNESPESVKKNKEAIWILKAAVDWRQLNIAANQTSAHQLWK